MYWAAYLIGLIPILAVLVLRERRLVYQLVALGLGMSFLADTLVLGGMSWTEATYIYPLFQMALIGVAVINRRDLAAGFVIALMLAAALSAIQGSTESAEIVVRIGGALAICVLIWNETELGGIRTALLIYLGLGSVFRVAFPLFDVLPLWLWGGYQLCRASGTAVFVYSIYKEGGPRLVRI